MKRIHYLLLALGLAIILGGAFMLLRDVSPYTGSMTNDGTTASSTDSGVDMTTATNTDKTLVSPDSTNRLMPQDKMPETPVNDTEQFTGVLTEVNTGCFADGECYAVVGGKHVTLMVGWYQGMVGEIVGATSIADLESKIGSNVYVLATKDKQTGKYSILGSDKFKFILNTVQPPVYEGIDDSDQVVPKAIVGPGCMIGGCSSQMCGEAGSMDGMFSTCEWRQQYSCYQTARCEKQQNGKCGWTQTEGLLMCLAENI